MNILQRLFTKPSNEVVRKDGGLRAVFQTLGGVSGERTFSRKDYYTGIVYSCVDAIAQAVSSTGFDLYQNQKSGEPKEIMKHPVLDLLLRPNAYQTSVDLLYLLSSHIDTQGRAVIYPVPSKATSLGGIVKNPVELWALDPSRLRVVAGKGFIEGYVYRNPQGVDVPFMPNELIVIQRPHPFNQYEGVSTIEMARLTIEADLNAQYFNKSFFANSATPNGALSTEQLVDDDVWKRIKEQWDEQYKGVSNAHKTLLLEGGLKYQAFQPTQKDMEFVSQRGFSRDEILAIFKVPKTIVAITDDVNRANAETSDYVFASRVVKPRLELIFEKLNRFLLPMFGDNDSLELIYDDPVPENKELELAEDTQAVNKWLTINEVRAKRGYEPIEGGDVLYSQGISMPIGMDLTFTEPKDTTSNDDGEDDGDGNPDDGQKQVKKKFKKA